jgi:hypothetical protein
MSKGQKSSLEGAVTGQIWNVGQFKHEKQF